MAALGLSITTNTKTIRHQATCFAAADDVEGKQDEQHSGLLRSLPSKDSYII